MNISQQIEAFQLKRQEADDRMKELLARSAEEGRTLDEDEDSEYGSLDTELKALDKHLDRLKAHEAAEAAAAEPVQTQRNIGPTVLLRKHDPDDEFQGQSFVRKVRAKALAHIHGRAPADVAQRLWGKTHPNLVAVIKAGVEGAGTDTGEWGAELAQSDTRYTGDFISYLSQMTVFDKLPLRVVPANIHIKGQDGIGTGYWVGQSNAIPVSAQDFSDVELRNLKVGAISVMSNEWLEDSSPSGEMLVRDGLATALAQRVDLTFLSADVAVSGVSPAGLLNGLTSLGSNGITADALRQDVRELYAPFIAAFNASGLYYVMPTSLAKSIQLVYNALGQPEFNNISSMGGTLLGDPVVTGDNVPANHLILLKPSDIYRIGDSGLRVDITRDATIEQDSAPQGESQGPTAATANLVSMWQTESTGIKVVRRLNFAKRRASAVAFIGDAQYGITGATTA